MEPSLEIRMIVICKYVSPGYVIVFQESGGVGYKSASLTWYLEVIVILNPATSLKLRNKALR